MAVVVIVGTIANMQPAAATAVMFQDALVEVQMVDNPVIPLAGGVQVGYMDISCTTVEVLRVADTMYRLVQLFTPVATINVNGMAYVVAQRLQHLSAELAQVNHHLPRLWYVINTQTVCRLTLYEFAQTEIRRELSIWIIILHIFTCFFMCYTFVCFRLSGLMTMQR